MTMDPGRRLRSGPSYSDSISGSRVESLYPLRKGARLKGRVTLDVIPRLVAAGDENRPTWSSRCGTLPLGEKLFILVSLFDIIKPKRHQWDGSKSVPHMRGPEPLPNGIVLRATARSPHARG